MKQELISVVIPIYNQESYIERCLQSLISQSYQNIEIIAVNDGSSDGSLKIIKRIAKNDCRVKIIDKANGGVVDAIYSGVNICNGTYVCFVDPDDFVGQHYIETFLDSIGDRDFVAMGFYFDKREGVFAQELLADKTFDLVSLRDVCNYFPFSRMGSSSNNDFFSAKWNKMYRLTMIKNIIEQYHRYSGLSLGEDALFTYLVLMNSSSGITFKRPNTYFYNVSNPISMMSDHRRGIESIEKSKKAFNCFLNLCNVYSNNCGQPYYLYYILYRTIINNAKRGGKQTLLPVLIHFKSDLIYKESLVRVKKRLSKKERLTSFLFKIMPVRLYCDILLLKKHTK